MLVLFDGWASLFRDRVVPWRIGMAEKVRAQLEREVLPRFVADAALVRGEGRRRSSASTLVDHAEWKARRAQLAGRAGSTSRRRGGAGDLFPAAGAGLGGRRRGARCARSRRSTVAKVRQQAQVGVLADAFGDEAFCRALVDGDRRGRASCKTAQGRLRFTPTRRVRASWPATPSTRLPVAAPRAQSSNTIVTLGERLFLKAYRRAAGRASIPELEIGRFLTDVAQFREQRAGGRQRSSTSAPTARTTTLALLQAYVANQGDGWTYTLNYLERFLDEQATLAAADAAAARTLHGGYLALDAHARPAHRRAARGAGAQHAAIRRSIPSRSRRADVSGLDQARVRRARPTQTLDLLGSARDDLPLPARDAATRAGAQREAARAHRRLRAARGRRR